MKSKKIKFTGNGWITDKGEFISCKWANHYSTLSKLSREKGIDSFKAEQNWLKITDNRITGEFNIYLLSDEPTQALIDTYFDWCKFFKSDYAWKIFNEKYLTQPKG